ncbi:MAG: TonB-dependent receptor plug domain-containing protein [Nitrospinaceae bacterium]
MEMDLQKLMQMDVVVTSVSKRPQKLHETASAIYVVTQEDIRRSAAVNIPEVLRLVPGVLVSKIDQNQYNVSIRGFNADFRSKKLLVIIDGRSIYNPLSSGVRWEAVDVMLEDIDRIEVIRGPGAVLWGSNAVAGVINIITKPAAETQGTLLAGGAGTEERGFATLRYGGTLGGKFHYRVYGKYRDRDDGKRSDGTDAFDDRQIRKAGFRTDWQATPNDQFTFQGDYHNIEVESDIVSNFTSFTPPHSAPLKTTREHKWGNFIGRWTRQLENGSGFKFQIFYNRFGFLDDQPLDIQTDQADLEFQYDFNWEDRHKVSWGLNYRYANIDFLDSPFIQIKSGDTNQFAFFFHDEITLVPGTWKLLLGSRFEHNEFSGFEVQPSIRTVWTPHPGHTLWMAVSRAVRIPSFSEDNIVANFSVAPSRLLRFIADGRTEAEELLAFEAGYRVKPVPELSFDITGYLHKYDDLIDLVQGTPFLETSPGAPNQITPFNNENALKGEVLGVEVSAEWKPVEHWLLSGSFTYSTLDLRPTVNMPTLAILAAEDEPNILFNVRSYLELPYDLELDTLVYFQSDYPGVQLDSFTRVDLRLGWKPTRAFEFSLAGQNLQDARHPEFDNRREFRTETERSFYAKATFRFK